MFQQDGKPERVADANLQKHLGSKSLEELQTEINSMFEEEERTGIQADPKLVAAYAAAMEEKNHDPVTQPPGDFGESWATFTQNHPNLFPNTKTRSRNRRMTLRRAIEITVLAAALLVFTAGAFRWPDYLIDWGREVLNFGPGELPGGVMELSEPNENGYRSLAEAAANLGPEGVKVPTWIPEGYKIETIIFQEATSYNVARAVYTVDDLQLIIRVSYYFEVVDMPDLVYEKNDDERQTVYTYDHVEHLFVENFDRVQAMWKNGHYLYSISGDVTVEDMERMVQSIYGG